MDIIGNKRAEDEAFREDVRTVGVRLKGEFREHGFDADEGLSIWSLGVERRHGMAVSMGVGRYMSWKMPLRLWSGSVQQEQVR